MRTKQVFSTHEIPHLWVHQTQASARNRQGNLFFTERIIYSYGTHFIIARLVDGPNGQCVFINERRYSSITAGHRSAVMKAIPHGMHTFIVPMPGCSPADNARMLRERLHEAYKHLIMATKRKQPKLYRELCSLVEDVRYFHEAFNLRFDFASPADMQSALGIGNEMLKASYRAARRAERKQKRKAEIEQKRFETEELPEIIWAWRAGESIRAFSRFDNRVPIMLRIIESEDGQEIETTLGAVFPIEHAMRALPIVERIINAGEKWEANGHSIHLGHYQIDSIDTDGTIHAGCHVIRKDEVLKLIEALKGM